ncbi:MAG: hypothetical protein R8K49_04865 [Mariprofundaceae bacterium]
MTSKSKSRSHDRMGLWMVLIAMVITAVVFIWTRSYYQHSDPNLATRVDSQGKLHVLGITLGQTTLKQAELILQSKSDIAIYLYPQGHHKQGRKLEAFFPAIADHTKVILLLDIKPNNLDQIESRATIPHLYPDHVARMNLAANDRIILDQAIVNELTLIPSLTVSADVLKARFGEPDQFIPMKGYDQYTYNSIGLQVRLTKEEPPTLHFSNPLTLLSVE